MPGETLRDCWSRDSRDLGGDRSGQIRARALSWPAREARMDLDGNA